jgi:hypothetical protein
MFSLKAPQHRGATNKEGAPMKPAQRQPSEPTEMRNLSWMRAWAVTAGILLLALAAIPVRAEPALLVDSSAQCDALPKSDFSQVQDAPTQVTESTLVTPFGNAPGYCQVSGYVAPNVGFLLRLPLANWNGKFMEVGCGSTCGYFWTQQCDEPLRKGYACVASDMGHKGALGGTDALWAQNNLQAKADLGYRAAHVVALAGKAISERYYNKAPDKSYFMGCSSGGREAMIEAQRFPWDFDGIVAGAPSLSEAGSNLTHIWWLREMTAGNHKPLFSLSDLQMVHAAALKKCDMDDGVKDGIIGNPASCQFDPTTLLCGVGEATGCLSRVQVEALIRVYRGPVTSAGIQVYPGRAFPGSELNLPNRNLSTAQIESQFNSLTDVFRYIELDSVPGSAWNADNFDFDADYKRLGEAQGLSSARNPDLRAYKNAGGKLISYVGLNDIDQADVTIDYYTTVEKTMGGRGSTQDFFRLFTIPAMNHCTRGEGAFDADYLDALEGWVERHQAPDKLIAYHVRVEDLSPKDYDAIDRRLEFPLDPTTVIFSRPVYPYPVQARYLGHGNPNDAGSFGPHEVADRNGN